MKNNFIKIFFLTVSTLSCLQNHATDGPPSPQRILPPVGLPIDNGLVIMFFVSLILGYFFIQKIQNKKTPN